MVLVWFWFGFLLWFWFGLVFVVFVVFDGLSKRSGTRVSAGRFASEGGAKRALATPTPSPTSNQKNKRFTDFCLIGLWNDGTQF